MSNRRGIFELWRKQAAIKSGSGETATGTEAATTQETRAAAEEGLQLQTEVNGGSWSIKAYFDRVCLVNLRRRPDRLEQFQKELERLDWPFQSPMIVPACDGRAVPQPAYFKGGAGAWGCLRSHSWILEQAMADGVKSLLILEDDAFFPAPSTFREDVETVPGRGAPRIGTASCSVDNISAAGPVSSSRGW